MKTVVVQGGNKFQREMIQNLAEWTLKELLPRHRRVDVAIRLKDLSKDGVDGWCMEEEDRFFIVDVEKKQSLT